MIDPNNEAERNRKTYIEPALMTQRHFDGLLDYSTSVPTGVYLWKQWRMHRPDGSRFLREYVEGGAEEGEIVMVTHRWPIDQDPHRWPIDEDPATGVAEHPKLERLRDAALRVEEIFGPPDGSMLEFLAPEQADAIRDYWDAVEAIKPVGDGKPPTQYLRPKVVAMDARANDPDTT